MKEYCHNVSRYIRSRLSWTDLNLMRDIIFMLSSHGWEKSIQEEDNFAAIDRLVIRFTLPLQAAQADTTVIKAEFGNMIEYVCCAHREVTKEQSSGVAPL